MAVLPTSCRDLEGNGAQVKRLPQLVDYHRQCIAPIHDLSCCRLTMSPTNGGWYSSHCSSSQNTAAKQPLWPGQEPSSSKVSSVSRLCGRCVQLGVPHSYSTYTCCLPTALLVLLPTSGSFFGHCFFQRSISANRHHC